MKSKKVYFYEHINGRVIMKPSIVVDMAGGPNIYFESPSCKRWWVEYDWFPGKTVKKPGATIKGAKG